MTVNPATDEEEMIFIPAAKERSMGRIINEKVCKHYDMPVDPLMQERIEKIGEKVASGTDRRDIVYRFRVLKGKEGEKRKEKNYNAFAVPGGYIYVFSDLVEELKDEKKIAGVLAHEMSHVEAKHSVKRMQGNIGVTLLMLLGTQMQVEQTNVSLGAAIGHLMAAYSRQDEKQADELSVKYMKRAGYDPGGTIGALETLRELRSKAPRMKYFFGKSHPYVSERIAHLKGVVAGGTSFESYINLVNDEDEM